MPSIPPTMLMLSHCLPDSGGEAHRARAWQLLRAASQTHQVRLVCLLDGPVHLEQWRALLPLTQGAHLVAHGLGSRRLDRCLNAVGGSSLVARRLERKLAPFLAAPDLAGPYDAVLHTHPCLHRLAEGIEASRHLGDLSAAGSAGHHLSPDYAGHVPAQAA